MLLLKVLLLAAVYFVTGKIGLSFAVPEGFVSVIWPPSGIALGALLAYGRQLWPGIFIGSFAVNCMIGQVWNAGAIVPDKALLAACIAAGSTLQGLAGHALLRRLLGLPLRLASVTDAMRLFAIAGPVACLIASSVGVASLYVHGTVTADGILQNWVSWWVGDMFGVIVFVPLMLLLPGSSGVQNWKERTGRDLRAVGLALLALPLGLTFYAWKFLVNSAHAQTQAHFEALARESEQAIAARLASYAGATRSGAGVLQSSKFVTRAEWRTFAETMRLRDDYPGMAGLGWIEHVPAWAEAQYLARVRADMAPNFRIHPTSDGAAIDVLTYMEPEVANGAALGLNLAADPRSLEAAERAAATGTPTLSRAMPLIQDEESAPGFLLMQAVYQAGMPLDSAEARRRALRGYVYAPFLARAFVEGITPNAGRDFDIDIMEDADAAIIGAAATETRSRYQLRREVTYYGQPWTLVWRSTPTFDQAEHSDAGLFVLFGGLLFTGLLAVLLLALDARREIVEVRGVFKRPCVLPVATGLLIAGCSLGAYALLSAAEDKRIGSLVDEQARLIEKELDAGIRSRLQSLRRMAHRWASGGGTAYPVWRNDARDHIRQVAGLEELQWIGPDYHVHWAEGAWRVGWTGNRDLLSYQELSRALQASAESGAPHVTEPREITPGENGFIIYTPLLRDGRFDGFLAAVFSSRTFFPESVNATSGSAFAYKVKYGTATYFNNGETPSTDAAWKRESGFSLDDRRWSFEVAPTQRFIDVNSTLMPRIALVAGLLIAVLSGILVRYVLVSRLKAARLQASSRALTESEARYALALRGMSVGLWDWDITRNSLYWSDRFKEILGIQPADFNSHFNDFASRVHPEDMSAVQAAISGHLKQRRPYDIEFRMRRGDGEYIWVHVYGQAHFDADGHAGRMAGSLQDVTHQHQAQQALVRSESQLRLLVGNAPAAVAMFDCEMRYLMTSQRWLQDYGLENRDIIGMSHYEVFPEIRGMAHWVDIHQRAIRGERFDIREDSWTRANGQKEWNQWAIHPWIDADGKVGGIVMFTEVITARKLAEAALRTSEAMNRAAMDKAPIGKALVRPDGRFLRVNPALCRMLGYVERDLLSSDFQAITHADDLAADLANLRALLDGKVVSYQMEKRYIHRDGRLIWALLSVSLVRNEKGEVDFLVAQIQDIGDRKAAELVKDEFIAVMGRELGGPLTVIRESLAMIGGQNHELPPNVQRLLGASRASCERLMTLANHMHDLDEISSGRMRFELRDESIADLVRMAVEAGRPRARQHDASIVLADVDPALTVYVDPGRLVQALDNLLSNAAKFSPRGGTIHVGVESRAASVRITVRDEGAGIPEEFRARIFGRFAQGGETARQKGGAGLGLHITRQLVEQMRGTVGFTTQQDAGTTFWMEFPVVARRGAVRAG